MNLGNTLQRLNYFLMSSCLFLMVFVGAKLLYSSEIEGTFEGTFEPYVIIFIVIVCLIGGFFLLDKGIEGNEN